jgi:hypothetical protein
VQKFVQQLQKSAQAQTTRSEGDVRKVKQSGVAVVVAVGGGGRR